MLVVLFFNGRDRSKNSTDALKRSEERYRTILEQMYDSFYEVDLAGNFTFVNDATCLNLGYSKEELIGNNFQIVLSENDAKTVFQAFHTVYVSGEPNKGFAFEVTRKDGTTGFAESSVSLRKNERGKTIGFRSISRDITERKKAEEALKDSEEKYRTLIENINDVFYALDAQGNISYVSPVVERYTHYKVSDLIGKPFTPLIYPDDLPALLESFNRLVSGQLEPWEFRIVDKDGRVIFVRTSSRPLYENGEIVGITALMTDITERKRMEQKLEEMATHDFLTGLPNRILLTDRFTIAAALSHRNKARLAVMSLDLDKFKTINDTLGHAAGDQVLKTVATRITGLIRASDTLARVGGDEFVLVMLETKRKEDAAFIAQKILDAFAEPLLIDGHLLNLSTSIGIAVYPEDAADLETLVKKSDAAMYYSKGHGRNQFKFFSDGDVRMGGDHKSGN
jgi:diguanylate cyclase (GGDEF)-like protein/PAS domain S-box-containing protein